MAYQVAVTAWNMRPMDFWSLHPEEFHWLLEARKPVKMFGNMTEDEVAESYEIAFGENTNG